MSAEARIRAAVRNGFWLALFLCSPAAAAAQPPGRGADLAGQAATPPARAVADRVVRDDDNKGLPFLIVDKVQARVFAFDPRGVLVASSPALVGLAQGDSSAPGIGTMRLADIGPALRTTPAGRFEAMLGTNLRGQGILWVDYGAAISLHRVATGNPSERRLQRLATPTVADNRITYGCINVPVAFYEQVVEPLFSPADGIVYILAETG